MSLARAATLLAALALSVAARAATFTVNLTEDVDDGTCAPADCTLREAVEDANSTPGVDLIVFAIPGAGPHVFPMTVDLFVVDDVIIDGYTQPGASPNHLDVSTDAVIKLFLNGSGCTDPLASGFTIQNAFVTIRGLAIGNYPRFGILVQADDARVQGCYLGTNASGLLAAPNGGGGSGFPGGGLGIEGDGAIVGGPLPFYRNVISGNAGTGILLRGWDDCVIHGNYVGTIATGSAPLPNHVGVWLEPGSERTQVGGASAAERNVISGNGNAGIIVGSGCDDTRITSNYVGVNATGVGALGNGSSGIAAFDAGDVTIGAPGEGNVVSGNATGGIVLSGPAMVATVQGNIIGLDATGTNALGNVSYGIATALGATEATIGGLGGMATGRGNVVSGNLGPGIQVQTDGNFVGGNHVGTDVTGLLPRGNGEDGILVLGGGQNVIGPFGSENVVAANGRHGIHLAGTLGGSDGNVVWTNKVGMGSDCETVLPNAVNGIVVISGTGNVVGRPPGELFGGNVVSGPSTGVRIAGGAVGTIVTSNRIGTTCSGQEVGNAVGVDVDDASGTLIGTAPVSLVPGNDIGFSAIGITIVAGLGNRIGLNSIHDSTFAGVDIGPFGPTPNDFPFDTDTGANELQNFPVLTLADVALNVIEGRLDSMPLRAFTIDLYASEGCHPSGRGEAHDFLLRVNLITGSAGADTFSVPFPSLLPAGSVITAIATDENGNSSELSACIAVTGWEPALALSPEPFNFVDTDELTIQVTDLPANTDPGVVETVVAHVWSTSDPVGFDVVLPEESASSAYFEEIVTLADAPSDASSRMLRAMPGEVVHVSYEMLSDEIFLGSLDGPDSDDDGLTDAFEAGFAGCPTCVIVSSPETGHLAAAEGSAAGGSTIVMGSFTVDLPPGTTTNAGNVVLLPSPGPPTTMDVLGANLNGATKAITMPFDAAVRPLLCVLDDAFASAGGALDDGTCTGTLVEVPDADGASTTLDVLGNATAWTVTRESTVPPRVRIAGLSHTSLATYACDGAGATLVPPAAAVADCGADLSPAALGLPLPTDFCGQAEITHSDTLTPTCGGAGTIERRFVASDGIVELEAVQLITVVDGVAPALVMPADTMVECGGDTSTAATGIATAADACSPPTVTPSDAWSAGGCAGEGLLTRTWTAVDACGHEVSQQQLVVVQDTAPPGVQAGDDDLHEIRAMGHRMVRFVAAQFEPVVWDTCTAGPTWRFTGCASDQDFVNRGGGDGQSDPDCLVAPDGRWFMVRAERSGRVMDGRRYAVEVVATDDCGNESLPTVIGFIHVPHDNRRRR